MNNPKSSRRQNYASSDVDNLKKFLNYKQSNLNAESLEQPSKGKNKYHLRVNSESVGGSQSSLVQIGENHNDSTLPEIPQVTNNSMYASNSKSIDKVGPFMVGQKINRQNQKSLFKYSTNDNSYNDISSVQLLNNPSNQML